MTGEDRFAIGVVTAGVIALAWIVGAAVLGGRVRGSDFWRGQKDLQEWLEARRETGR